MLQAAATGVVPGGGGPQGEAGPSHLADPGQLVLQVLDGAVLRLQDVLWRERRVRAGDVSLGQVRGGVWGIAAWHTGRWPRGKVSREKGGSTGLWKLQRGRPGGSNQERSELTHPHPGPRVLLWGPLCVELLYPFVAHPLR